MVNGAYLVSRNLIDSLVQDDLLTKVLVHRLMMWQTAVSYEMDSFFLLLDRKLDEGLALLRMAAELARDVARIGDDQGLLEVWLRRAEGKEQRKAFKKLFRFVESDVTERHVRKLYDLASNFGVHGHNSSNMYTYVRSTSPDGKLVALEVLDVVVYRTLEIWLASFFPLQELCFRTFGSACGTNSKQAHEHYRKMSEEFDVVFKIFRDSLLILDE
jgi:hypothetical protein